MTSNAVKCENCQHLVLDGRDTRCTKVGTMSGIALLRECTFFKVRGHRLPDPRPERTDSEVPW